MTASTDQESNLSDAPRHDPDDRPEPPSEEPPLSPIEAEHEEKDAAKPGFGDFLARVGAGRWAALVVLVLGALAHFPSLVTRYLLDDYLHAAMIKGTFPAKRGPFDLYDFVTPKDHDSLTSRGLLPWWATPQLKIRFFRPLSSALIWIEHSWFGDAVLLFHLHSLLWWSAAVLAARSLFLRVLEPRPALIATLIFALAPCHTLPLAWLANREALISLTFGLFGLVALLRFLDGESKLWAGAATLLFALAVASGEYALCLGGYVAFAAVSGIRTDRRLRALIAPLAFAVPAIGYLALRSVLGFGTRGSGFYADPLSEPVKFFLNAPRRFATLFLEAIGSLDSDVLTVRTSAWLLGGIFLAVVVVFVVLARRALRDRDARLRTDAWWLLGGAAVAIAPVLAAIPSPRLLGAGMVGLAPIIALILERAWFLTPSTLSMGDPRNLASLALGFSVLIHAPLSSWMSGEHFRSATSKFELSANELRTHFEEQGSSDVFVMRGVVAPFFLPFALFANNAPPDRWSVLAQGGHVLARRRDARTIDVTGEPLVLLGAGNLYRDERSPMHVGQVFHGPGLTVTILSMTTDGPRDVRFVADRDLETFTWITEVDDGFLPAPPPAPGFGRPFDP